MRRKFILWLAGVLRVDLRPSIKPSDRNVSYVDLKTCSIEEIQLGNTSPSYLTQEEGEKYGLQEARRNLCNVLANELYNRPDLFHVYQSGFGVRRTHTASDYLKIYHKEFEGIIKIVKHHETCHV